MEMVNDVYGFYVVKYIRREGNEFPIPFHINNVTRLQFLSRNPMVLGFFMMLLGTMCYGPISYGRFLFSLWYIVAACVGMHFEEKELLRLNDAQYMMYYDLVPNRIVPNLSVLFMNED